jgi:hypothetical protein
VSLSSECLARLEVYPWIRADHAYHHHS